MTVEDEKLAESLARIEERGKANTRRIERLERETEALTRIATAVEVLANEQKNMSEELSRVAEKVSEIERLPVKRVEAFIYTAAASSSADSKTPRSDSSVKATVRAASRSV